MISSSAIQVGNKLVASTTPTTTIVVVYSTLFVSNVVVGKKATILATWSLERKLVRAH